MTDTEIALSSRLAAPVALAKGGALAPVAGRGGPMRADRFGSPEKAAIILMALGPETAARLLNGIGERRIRRFAKLVNDMREVPAEVVERVITEFLQKIEDTRSVGGGAIEARRFLAEVMDKDQVNQIMGDLDAAGRTVWSLLGDVDDARMAAWLRSEHPQVAAIALSRLTSVKAARVLERFEPSEADDVLLRMGPAVDADPVVASRIGEVIARDFLPTAMLKQHGQNPADMIAAVMNHVSPRTRDRLIEVMTNAAPQLAESVRKIMFTFDHIAERISPRDVSQITKAVDETVLLRAMKAGGERGRDITEFFMSNMPKRLSERMREDLAAAPTPTRKEGEAAQAELVAVIVELRDSGALKMIVAETLED
ncbi:MAG: FliG C-terminal domain-containing protein [Paracoccaceae bacterium]